MFTGFLSHNRLQGPTIRTLHIVSARSFSTLTSVVTEGTFLFVLVFLPHCTLGHLLYNLKRLHYHKNGKLRNIRASYRGYGTGSSRSFLLYALYVLET